MFVFIPYDIHSSNFTQKRNLFFSFFLIFFLPLFFIYIIEDSSLMQYFSSSDHHFHSVPLSPFPSSLSVLPPTPVIPYLNCVGQAETRHYLRVRCTVWHTPAALCSPSYIKHNYRTLETTPRKILSLTLIISFFFLDHKTSRNYEGKTDGFSPFYFTGRKTQLL